MAIRAPRQLSSAVVAAITAAIYAATGDSHVEIRDIRPMEPAPAPFWQKAGLLDMMSRRSSLYDRRR